MDLPSGEVSQTIVSDIVGVVAGAEISEPIKQNFFKAFGQLCTAAVEIPVAYLEGIAQERRAETHARVKIIEISANEIAGQMQFDPEYARAAVKKFGQRVIREQINLDRITQKAAESIITNAAQEADQKAQSDTQTSPPQIDDDWLNVFEKEARQKSTQEMQDVFAKILAGEIQQPNSFSIRAVRLLGSLDQNTADIFRKFCSMCITLRYGTRLFDARVPSLGTVAASNGLQKYGLAFNSLNVLQEYGLIIADYNSWMDYSLSFGNATQGVMVPFEFDENLWTLVKTNSFQGNEIKVNGVAATQAGRELMKIVPRQADPQFLADLTRWFESQNLVMTGVNIKRA